MTEAVQLGVIGGSGIYKMDSLEDPTEIEITTPFGKPSSPVISGLIEGRRVAFIARHGIGHHISPTEVNYRANIYAMKAIGAERVVSISACGSLREDYAPGEIVIPDQLFDLTHHRARSFFGEGLVAHVSVAEPFCPYFSGLLAEAVHTTSAVVHHGGAIITIEGPRFSTRAESNVYRSWGMSLIGMTTSPEAFLAREAELCYTVMAHVTDYDVWHISEAPVTVDMVIETLNRNTLVAQQALTALINRLPVERPCACGDALGSALITHPHAVPPETRSKLGLLVNRYYK